MIIDTVNVIRIFLLAALVSLRMVEVPSFGTVLEPLLPRKIQQYLGCILRTRYPGFRYLRESIHVILCIF